MHPNTDLNLDLTYVYHEPFLWKYWTYITKSLRHVVSHDLKLWDEYDLIMFAMTFVAVVNMVITENVPEMHILHFRYVFYMVRGKKWWNFIDMSALSP